MTDTNEQPIVNSGTSLDIESRIQQFLTDKFGDAILRDESFRGDRQYTVKPERIYAICRALQDADELDVRFLADITCVDWLGHPEEENGRFEVVYNLCSLGHKYRFFLKARLSGTDPHIQSIVDLWHGANWLEREVWDMFGVRFDGHPDLTKILTPDDLEGHPLRQDFPLTYEQPKFSWNLNEPPEIVK